MIEQLKEILKTNIDFNKGKTQCINIEAVAKIYFVVYSDMVSVTYIDTDLQISIEDYSEVEQILKESIIK